MTLMREFDVLDCITLISLIALSLVVSCHTREYDKNYFTL